MAPEVGAETYGIAMGYESVASAAGGWANVDADQMAQVHKNEMVLPAKFNQGMTNLVNSFASGGQNDSGGGKSSKGFTLQAMPVSDDHMLVRQGDLVALIQKANDRFQFGGRR
jgi:hypothetical protein